MGQGNTDWEVNVSKPAILALEDGTVFHGLSIGADGTTVGEVVFNTAMTGYQEILTDPSYAKQIVRNCSYPGPFCSCITQGKGLFNSTGWTGGKFAVSGQL